MILKTEYNFVYYDKTEYMMCKITAKFADLAKSSPNLVLEAIHISQIP